MTVTSRRLSASCGTRAPCRAKRLSEGGIDQLQRNVGIAIHVKTLEPGVAKAELLFTGPTAEEIISRSSDNWFARPLGLTENHPPVFGFPGGRISGRKGSFKINLHRQDQLTAWARVDLQARIRLAAASHNEHDGPLGAAKAAME